MLCHTCDSLRVRPRKPTELKCAPGIKYVFVPVPVLRLREEARVRSKRRPFACVTCPSSVTVPFVSFSSSQCVNLLPVFSAALPVNLRRSAPEWGSEDARVRVRVSHLLRAGARSRNCKESLVWVRRRCASWWGRLPHERSAFPTGGTHSFEESRGTVRSLVVRQTSGWARGHVARFVGTSAPSSGQTTHTTRTTPEEHTGESLVSQREGTRFGLRI